MTDEHKDKLEVGDKVSIYFVSGASICDATLQYTPCATGDSWRFLDSDGRTVHYVRMFERITRHAPDPELGF